MRAPFVRLCGVALLAVVLVLAIGADPPRPQLIAQQDKFEHLGAFLALGLVFGWNASAAALVTTAICLTGGAFGIEVVQGLVHTGHDSDVMDALASSVGGLAGLGLAIAFARLNRGAIQGPLPA